MKSSIAEYVNFDENIILSLKELAQKNEAE
jgi:hypothetical protein